MNNFLRIISLAILSSSCTVIEPVCPDNGIAPTAFARIESVNKTDTRVYADENLKVLWHSDDRISLFNKNSANRQYRFTDETGAASGVFVDVTSNSVTTGKDLDLVYSVYPYKEKNAISEKGLIKMELPSEQVFGKESFGPGANTMVSATTGTELFFKNLGGYLILKLYGKDVSVSSITLRGNHEEPLAGSASVTATVDGNPSYLFSGTENVTSLTLTCPNPVQIGKTAETATAFWLVVPPMTFREGFTVTVTDSEGSLLERSISSQVDILRNTTFRMKPLEVVPEPTYQVTNEYVQKYMDEVYYADMDFCDSVLHGSAFPGGGPGENDIPPTVTLEWSKPSSSAGKITVILKHDDWSREYQLAEKTAKLEVTNLVPGTRYTYEVTSKNSGNLTKGAFRTKGSLHQVYYTENVRNGRDLGGWKTVDGKTVRYQKLYRGGQISRHYINGNGKKEMLAEGIKAEIDLREKEDVPSSSPLGSDIAFCAPGFDSGYVDGMLKGNPEGVRKCFEFTVNCLREDKPVYFHCAAGRDRTGTFSILLLGLLGVREGDLAKDYELTYFSPEEWSMQKIDGQMVYNHTRDVSTYRATVEYLSSFDTSSFKSGVEKYLLSIGVSQKDIDDLRSMMLK